VATTDTTLAQAQPVSRWRLYLALTKPKVVALIVLTAVVGTLLATPGLPPLDALLLGNLGIGLAAASAATLPAEVVSVAIAPPSLSPWRAAQPSQIGDTRAGRIVLRGRDRRKSRRLRQTQAVPEERIDLQHGLFARESGGAQHPLVARQEADLREQRGDRRDDRGLHDGPASSPPGALA